jgi:uncharacterized membrane protein YeaQ/YmgE (transglycosylase-associated protein family)
MSERCAFGRISDNVPALKQWCDVRDRRNSGTPLRDNGFTGEKATVEIIGVLIAGVIIGLLGKFVAPGDRDNIPLWLTVLCGIGGVLIGYYVAAALGVEATKGIDWLRWIISIIVAAVLVVIAASVTGRRTGRRI